MNYTKIAATGDKLLRKFGLAMKLVRDGSAVGSGFGVFVNSKKEDDAGSVRAQTTYTTKNLMLSGLAKEPLVGDVLTADKGSWTVQTVEAVRPASTTVIYKLTVI